ncbi:hypothetical protein [Nocardia terpenica]|uniref:Uncharacterized protein n=1 Tax=Nocardia terpenica TaxID=455432 RepID=A0A6G9Z0P3_9NOCA|nr:hypothetical protein [Nocardia terpenica]QIS19024.1 hypothetical protein F6W96_12665 [Nocardia terpenica]
MRYFRRAEHRAFLPTLRDYARRSFGRHMLTPQERANLAAGRRPAAVYCASLGCHPDF